MNTSQILLLLEIIGTSYGVTKYFLFFSDNFEDLIGSDASLLHRAFTFTWSILFVAFVMAFIWPVALYKDLRDLMRNTAR